VVEAAFGPGLVRDVPVVGTVMSMSVVPFFPRSVPLVVGTERIREAAVEAGHRRVTLLEPWVDTDTDSPAVSGAGFRAAYGIPRGDVVVAMVCRLVPELKLEGLLAACDAVGELAASGRRVRLLIAGDGRARDEVAERAAKANAAAGWDAIVLTGELADPRPAYAAADVLIGQGGSALRGMAFEKPIVVVGEEGFSEVLTPRSLPLFLEQGWYGLGAGSLGSGVTGLREGLRQLVDSVRMRAELGAFARQVVVDRFSLERAAALQEKEYFAAISERAGAFRQLGDLARTGTGVAGTTLRRKFHRWRGGAVATDDANARPLAGPAPTADSGKG
jgi:glycosyltransferase involved in cell wall biosynthesis